MKKYTTDDFLHGRVAVINDGTTDELQHLFSKAALKQYSGIQGMFRFYWLSVFGLMGSDSHPMMPSQSINEFMDVWNPKVGELVEVSNDGSLWIIRPYLGTVPFSWDPFVVVSNIETKELSFKEGDVYKSSGFKYMRKYQKVILTKQQVADKFNISVDQLVVL